MESYLTWLLRRVARAVEAGDVPADLLVELQAEIEATKERPQNEGHAAAIRQIADIAGVDPEKAAEVLTTLEAQPTVTREPLIRRIAEAWLAGQWRTHDRRGR
ncbi:MAG TPA: hypothetical protein VLH58_12775 [Candidatus Methylomirabilis sp.]|nr:hypothetical protein [Candidatus Methylomirabilis sp.]